MRRHRARRQSPKTKAKQQKHAAKRLLQRFALTYSRSEIDEIGRRIRSGKGKLIRRVSIRLVVHRMTIGGRDMAVYYDGQRHAVVTVKPLRWEGVDAGPVQA